VASTQQQLATKELLHCTRFSLCSHYGTVLINQSINVTAVLVHQGFILWLVAVSKPPHCVYSSCEQPLHVPPGDSP
jgi:hypothetical protein